MIMPHQKTRMNKESQAHENTNGNEDCTGNWTRNYPCQSVGEWEEHLFCSLSGTLRRTKLQYEWARLSGKGI